MDCAGEIAGCDHHSSTVRGGQERLVPGPRHLPAELDQWCASATTALAEPQDARASPQATRMTASASKSSRRELLRKDRALAETAALLVLSKKVAAIYNKGEDA
jgi:transposase